ncbi:hypothetical protein P168DRAFT_291722 [Aspergillus campestris IBT 28561]|uniref:Uncharacterized protein n=1 Tax=Aspergillus campestris (strain IBT 28561) TaxID=1392248 RepID=A0A2I1CY64_ASPC2|nr:uncharacterized protein P168DRAFT_291722 [Aspergillus campestris IBT 28561]PKY02579.1 hypothetical protein P168DRAFT_291722 [Aspergillus campestris IBT 28561]
MPYPRSFSPRGNIARVDIFNHTQICQTQTLAAETAFPARSGSLNGIFILQWTDPTKDEEFLSFEAVDPDGLSG